ncbi:JmjC domain-containing protein [Strongyloides ratti]|uniref:JmjC domain-containing protein n=1 Tax=Strongyloides ratti TaxID=34506 RepID=A0A090LP67_STRRB|nr:JmjC domain-containing protein [Strongyloides ratti]CEF71630.1 JmjC domain-containing protein [Strongyloides ratti]
MQRLTRSSAPSMPNNEIIIVGYKNLCFSNAATNDVFVRPDMYKIVEENEEFDINYIKGDTCNVPVLFKCSRTKLGIQSSEENYSNIQVIEDNCVGSTKCMVAYDGKAYMKEILLSDIIDNMKLEHGRRKHVYNALSICYAFMDLSTKFQSPKFATEFDLAIHNWPDILKIAQTQFAGNDTQIGEELVVPFTWNYLTISAKGSYTDFQISFGGSSIWISIIFGKKTCWLIPPTDYNLNAYEFYLKDSSASKLFFGFVAENCCRITLTAGQSFYLPAG